MKDIIKRKRRYILMILGIVIFLPPLSAIPQMAGEVNMCGSVCPRMFFILSTKGIWSGFITGIQSMWFGAALVGVILIITFFFGRLWCSHICPVGGSTEIVSSGIPGRLKIDFSFINSPGFRYGYLLIYIAGALIGIGSIACKLCNFRVIPFLAGSPFVPAYRTYLTTSMGAAGLMTIGLLGFFAKGGRAYCNLICPVGALDSAVNYISSRLSFTKRLRTDKSRCNGCGQCISSCMVWALKIEGQKIKRDELSCMSCRECEKVCPNGAIGYGKTGS
jgi:polyferredoxin